MRVTVRALGSRARHMRVTLEVFLGVREAPRADVGSKERRQALARSGVIGDRRPLASCPRGRPHRNVSSTHLGTEKMLGHWRQCCSCSNCGFTARDVLKLSVPCLWTVTAVIFFCYYTVHPLVNNRFPKTIPLYWSFISAYPSFMTALNIFLFRLDSVKETGMSRDSISEVSQAVRLLALGGIGIFIIMATASAVQLGKCRLCEHSNYGESIAWFVIASVWIIFMAVTSPRPAHLNKLVYKYDTTFQQPTYVRDGPYLASDGSGQPCAYDWYGSGTGAPATNVVHGHPDGVLRAVGIVVPVQGAGLPDIAPGKVKGSHDGATEAIDSLNGAKRQSDRAE